MSAQPYSSNSQSVYGSSGLGTSSYNSAYQYNQLNHKSLSSSTPNSKEVGYVILLTKLIKLPTNDRCQLNIYSTHNFFGLHLISTDNAAINCIS